ncbi:hypothetical protein NKH18_23705 [Streptomyces sp. M10(2022)]
MRAVKLQQCGLDVQIVLGISTPSTRDASQWTRCGDSPTSTRSSSCASGSMPGAVFSAGRRARPTSWRPPSCCRAIWRTTTSTGRRRTSQGSTATTVSSMTSTTA